MNRNMRIKQRKKDKQISVPTYLLPGANEFSDEFNNKNLKNNKNKKNNKEEC